MRRGKMVDRRVLSMSEKISRRLVAEGAVSVVLAGSWVRGDAHQGSDIDLWAVGKKSTYHLELVSGFLVAVSQRTMSQFSNEFRDPAKVAGAVPGWREALILFDLHGLAKQLKREADSWRWDSIARKCDRWVAEQVTGYAEEVCKLVGNVRLRRYWAAAVQRSLLAIRMAPILAVHSRILYGSENRLWDLVGDSMGREWKNLQARAFGEGKVDFAESCKAALGLYAIAARSVLPLCNKQQTAVVEYACELSARYLDE